MASIGTRLVVVCGVSVFLPFFLFPFLRTDIFWEPGPEPDPNQPALIAKFEQQAHDEGLQGLGAKIRAGDLLDEVEEPREKAWEAGNPSPDHPIPSDQTARDSLVADIILLLGVGLWGVLGDHSPPKKSPLEELGYGQ